MPTTHVVSHTHWDREWYHTAGRFRQRLVALVDELVDDPPPDGASFLLDGQAVVLDDYLAVRPERSAELGALLRRGTLEAGPWFVLADELIPGGEALVRNLLAGRRVLRGLRAESPPVLYCPDAFGHPAALPALAAGFELHVAIVWRGFGSRRWPAAESCWWRAPSGERVLLHHLPRSGYEFGADLTADDADASIRWTEMRRELAPRERLRVSLLLNGADHHARQRALAPAIAALARAATPDVVRASSLGAFAAAALADAEHTELDEITGELRDSYGYAWTLQGTLATRAQQKRRAASLERALVREVEPWCALAARRTGRSRRALIHAAWRELLLCHPHDTLCGCAIDAVARAFDARLDDAESQASGLRDDALADLVGDDAEAAHAAKESWRPYLVIRNPAARARGGVAIVRVTRFVADVRVGPGSGSAPSANEVRLPAPNVPGANALQILRRALAHERTESPRAYPDDDLVEHADVAVWVPEMPGYGVRALPIASGRRRRKAIPNPVHVEGTCLANGRLSVEVTSDRAVRVHDPARGREIASLLAIDDQDDAGDLYTPSLRGTLRGGRMIGARVLHRGPLRGTIETKWKVDVRRGESVVLTVRFSLDADSPIVRVRVDGTNLARDHRLRIRFATGVPHAVVRADAAFGPVERHPIQLSAAEQESEAWIATAPLHRFVTLSGEDVGATLFSDGLAEYEASDDGSLSVTLVRAVGELSRNDLPERPGHAGWPSPTPEAECVGPFSAEFALLLHNAWNDDVADLIERTADDALVPLTGETIRSLVAMAPEMPGLALEGGGLSFSTAKESEDGEWLLLRCVNVLDRATTGRWRLAGGMREARASRLDETPGADLPVSGDAVEFEAAPRAVVTVLVR